MTPKEKMLRIEGELTKVTGLIKGLRPEHHQDGSLTKVVDYLGERQLELKAEQLNQQRGFPYLFSS
ncbi:hypothetical protein DEA06_06805 [Microbacterium sp. Gd 4-13]|uniref:hypothetical protein n=1 Tax=Microbacterium sp. Gd 4-13 TaxID=2173179 RepID=UPI000D567D7B|nr:hypothetical protein [Microbacterium sp. Gd 4-13]PVW05443.1 hypothetical protein DEA06_06805 [Microbacterium sp. Gd 4-13]